MIIEEVTEYVAEFKTVIVLPGLPRYGKMLSTWVIDVVRAINASGKREEELKERRFDRRYRSYHQDDENDDFINSGDISRGLNVRVQTTQAPSIDANTNVNSLTDAIPYIISWRARRGVTAANLFDWQDKTLEITARKNSLYASGVKELSNSVGKQEKLLINVTSAYEKSLLTGVLSLPAFTPKVPVPKGYTKLPGGFTPKIKNGLIQVSSFSKQSNAVVMYSKSARIRLINRLNRLGVKDAVASRFGTLVEIDNNSPPDLRAWFIAECIMGLKEGYAATMTAPIVLQAAPEPPKEREIPDWERVAATMKPPD